MEHSKKYLLIEPAVVQKLRDSVAAGNSINKKPPDVPTDTDADAPSVPVTPLAECDSEMRRILSLKHVGDSEKWRMYYQNLVRFRHYQSEARKPIKMELVSSPDVGVATVTNDGFLDELLAVLPQSAREKGVALFNRVKNSARIQWDHHGLVTVGNKLIPGSSIVDLLSDVLRNRAASNPSGWHLFVEGLMGDNTPSELIVNAKRKRFVADSRRRRRDNLKGPAAAAGGISGGKRRRGPADDNWGDIWYGT